MSVLQMVGRVLVFDPRTRKFLCDTQYPAMWTPHETWATPYSRDFIEDLARNEWPYLRDCELREVTA